MAVAHTWQTARGFPGARAWSSSTQSCRGAEAGSRTTTFRIGAEPEERSPEEEAEATAVAWRGVGAVPAPPVAATAVPCWVI